MNNNLCYIVVLIKQVLLNTILFNIPMKFKKLQKMSWGKYSTHQNCIAGLILDCPKQAQYHHNDVQEVDKDGCPLVT